MSAMMTMSEPSVIVHVVWHDAHSISSGWQTVDDISGEPCVVESVGMLLLKIKKDHVVIAQSRTDDDAVDHVLAIPVAMIRSMQVLSLDSVGAVSPSLSG
jgi:hypothetical protein